MRSLAYHSVLRRDTRTDGPSGNAKTAILNGVLNEFMDARWEIPADFMTYEHYERVLSKIDWTSSPGYPYMRRCPTNKEFFRAVDGQPSLLRKNQVWEIVQRRLRERDADPIRLFIKPEPHKLQKLEDGRYRLISSVSVIDQIIDHMIFGEMNEKLVQNWNYVPPKIGWSQYNGGWRSIPTERQMALDKKCWDWTVQIWVMEFILEVRMRLCLNLTDEWKDLATWRYKSLFVDPVFITSGGLMLRQRNPGVMKSGCVLTIGDNSIGQVLMHHRVCFENDIPPGTIMCMGDDTLQSVPENTRAYLDTMASFCKVKDPIYQSEFAGMRFYPGGRVEPLYKGKHAFTLLHVDPKVLPSLADSYALLYHRSSYRDMFEDLLLKMGQKVVDRESRDVIFDGF